MASSSLPQPLAPPMAEPREGICDSLAATLPLDETGGSFWSSALIHQAWQSHRCTGTCTCTQQVCQAWTLRFISLGASTPPSPGDTVPVLFLFPKSEVDEGSQPLFPGCFTPTLLARLPNSKLFIGPGTPWQGHEALSFAFTPPLNLSSQCPCGLVSGLLCQPCHLPPGPCPSLLIAGPLPDTFYSQRSEN